SDESWCSRAPIARIADGLDPAPTIVCGMFGGQWKKSHCRSGRSSSSTTSSASPERTRKSSWSASQWYIDIGSPGPRTKRFTPSCASSSPTRSLTEPRTPRSHHCMSRTLRTDQLTPETLRTQAVEHDAEVASPLSGRGVRQRRAHENPHVLGLHV